SSEVGVRKPHPRIYLSAVDRLGLRPEACLFVGDRVREDIEGPRSLGIRGVLTREFRQEDVGVGRPVGVIERFADLPRLLDRLR
ncbi:MAG: HAD family hydrolase, partial [Chloroflexi bacterium]|nr:HAD family hydrolase [Chloroflexota bacterium]